MSVVGFAFENVSKSDPDLQILFRRTSGAFDVNPILIFLCFVCAARQSDLPLQQHHSTR